MLIFSISQLPRTVLQELNVSGTVSLELLIYLVLGTVEAVPATALSLHVLLSLPELAGRTADRLRRLWVR